MANGQTFLPYGDLASNVNQFMSGQAAAPYLSNLPDYANLVNKRSQVAGQQLAGQVPDDVVNQIIQTASERGIMGGFGSGSQNMNAALLRVLGQTSTGIQQQGMQNLSQSIADTPVPELFNPMSLYVPMELGRQEFNYQQIGRNQELAQQQAMQRQQQSDAWNANTGSSTRYFPTSWRP